MYNRRFTPRNQQMRRNNSPSFNLIRQIRESQSKQQDVAPVEKKYDVIHATFQEFKISEKLKANILTKNYSIPTPIQDQTISHILEGKDIIGIANTGTGKTAAFLIPLIDKVIRNNNENVLIITPTRELALQIQDEFNSFVKGLGIYSTLCIGGTNMYRQRMEIRRNAQFIIGTPGRLTDLVKSKLLNLSAFHTVVLDEADRMVDIGFINDIKFFITQLPPERQSLFFSATIGQREKEIMQSFVKAPFTVSVKQGETAANVNQEIVKVISRDKKVDQLHELLIKKEFNKTLIFGRTKWGIQKLTDELIARGFKAAAIHGNKTQYQRQRALDQFKRNEISILLATDVASRGIDIQNVSHVINYEVPQTYEDYVHRIGRTGRANNKGTALTFID